jgi:hypothetical protein
VSLRLANIVPRGYAAERATIRQHKTGRPGRNAPADFHGKPRRNDTHESTTDPDARLYRKGPGQPAKLCFMGHAIETKTGTGWSWRSRRMSRARPGICRSKRTARHAGYAISQRRRKLVEEAFGWAKTIGGLARVKLRGLPRIRYQFTLAMAADNLIRMPKLLAATSGARGRNR